MTTTAVPTQPAWTLAGDLLDALTRRDFSAIRECLAPDVAFRGLIPPGPFAIDNATEAAARFERWFGGPDRFEVLDASAGQLGSKLALRWRVRMWPDDDEASARIAEQHVYATGTDRITTLDLLCSGFQREQAPTTCTLP